LALIAAFMGSGTTGPVGGAQTPLR
jgi:hypothetical protein